MDEQISLINDLILRIEKNENNLNELKNKIEYIEDLICKQNDISNALREMKYIQNIFIDKIISEIVKSREKYIEIANNCFYKFIERKDYKKEKTWGNFITHRLLNLMEIDENKNITYFRNVLTGAAIYGLNGVEWARTVNFNIKDCEFQKLKEIFNKNEYNNESIEISGIKYNIINCEDNNFIELKYEDFCASISKTEKAIIFGMYNLKSKFKENGMEIYQNKDTSNAIVKSLSESFKKEGF